MPGIIVYNGPSQYDGQSIVVILVKPEGKANSKTGALVQQYIIRDDMHPVEASRTGADYSICGNCKHRGKPSDKPSGQALERSCYVNLAFGVAGVYKAYKQGKYSRAHTIGDVQEFLSGNMLRLGAYGDPASLPEGLNDLLIGFAVGHTSYTHGHTVSEALGDNAARYSMVSVDSIDDARLAFAFGYRTFRVIPLSEINKPLLNNEIICPNVTKNVQCIDCRLCNGQLSKGKSIAIIAHGIGAKNA